MAKISNSIRRAIGAVVFVLLLAAFANYYLDLGYVGRHAKGLVILMTGVGLLYASFLFPPFPAPR